MKLKNRTTNTVEKPGICDRSLKKLFFNTNPNVVVIIKKLIVEWLKIIAKLGMVTRGEKKMLIIIEDNCSLSSIIFSLLFF